MIQYATQPALCKDCNAMFRQHKAKHYQRLRCPACHWAKRTRETIARNAMRMGP